jgi:osmotically-inducible protein OsmY
MSSRYDDRDYERRRRDYGRRSEYEDDRSYGERSQGYGRDENERERYLTESRWRGQYGGGREYGRGGSEYGSDYSSRSGRDYSSGRENYGSGRWENDRDTGDRERGHLRSERGYTGEQRYGSGSSGYSSRYNYPSGYRSGERYGERGRDYDYDREDYGSQEERGWWDRAADTVASWFGDEEAERRRRMDEQRRYHGRGPKGYRRSDERIKEDVNDRLSEGYLDATEIEVSVTNAEVTLTGTVNSRTDKRRAEDIAESVTGVTNVENRIRVKQSDLDRYTSSTSETTGTTGTTGTTTGTTATARGRTAGTI